MSHHTPTEYPTDDEGAARVPRPGGFRAAVWGIAGAVAASGAWVFGLVAAGVVRGFDVSVAFRNEPMIEAVIVLAGVCGGCGLVVGTAAGFLLNRAGRVGAAGAWGTGGAIVGALGGGLSPLLVRTVGAGLPVEVGSGVAWAVAGLLAGVLGFGWCRRTTGRHQPNDAPVLPKGGFRAAAMWGTVGAVGVGGAWVVGLVVANLLTGGGILPPFSADRLVDAVTRTAVIGVVYGLVVGVVNGLRSCASDPVGATVAWASIGAAAGAVGGGLSPLVVAAVGGALPVIVSSALSWALVGLVGGVIGSVCDRRRAKRAPTVDVTDWPDDAPDEPATPNAQRGRRPVLAPSPQLLPLLAVSFSCLVAVVVSPPSNVGWVVFAVGLLGLATAWSVAGQERRIRELERQLREAPRATVRHPDGAEDHHQAIAQ